MAKAIQAKAKKAAPTKRAVPKVSPLKGLTIEAWTERLSGWQADAVRTLVAQVKAAAPSSTASIKWAQPVFDEHGPFAWIRSAKAHVTLGFWRGAELSDPKSILQGDGDRMKHLKYTAPEQIDAAQIARFVSQAVRLNKEKGDPTKR